MQESVYADHFVTRFDEINRSANFSVGARYALFEYLEDLEQDSGEEIEFDPIALCGDYSEHASFEDWAKDYWGTVYLLEACESMGIEGDVAMGDAPGAIDAAIREYIQNRGQLIEFNGGIIVSSF